VYQIEKKNDDLDNVTILFDATNPTIILWLCVGSYFWIQCKII